MTGLRPSAVVLLTRGGGAEVYLCLRAQSCAFFGGYLALPGGNVDAADRALAPDDPERACAARELLEEVGVRAAPDALAPAGVLVTPPFAPVRYRTRVFHLELPEGEEPAVVPGELERGAWVRPADALAEWRAGATRIAPPIVLVLEALAHAPPERARAACAAACARQEQGEPFCVQCAPGVAMAPLPTPTVPPATTTNAYLVGLDAPYLVDPGTPYRGEQRKLQDALLRLAAVGRPVAGILLTHHHADHVGAVPALSERFGLPVHAHARTLERLPRGCVRGRALADGDALDLGRAPDGSADWRLRAHFTPGHDRGHLAFVESRYGAALLGDLCSTLSTIVIDPPEGHMATYLESLARARALAACGAIALACPAHGPTSARPVELLDAYLAHRRERERRLAGALRAEPRTLDDLCDAVYADARPDVRAYALRSLAAGLEKLAEERRARATSDGRAWARA